MNKIKRSPYPMSNAELSDSGSKPIDNQHSGSPNASPHLTAVNILSAWNQRRGYLLRPVLRLP